ncbi:hypothetical protein JTE90_025459 [Oedothorax gibbosus]|uniref:CRAL-TRIO domain-containing protein n=1 Tax=Oedothorax gibbosus TaxID=931172 RepID=A0AAV6U3T9_9ARAC|nr:hypothetical protein JTE90_025459 [Oedothorax gibbosus]
MSSINRDKIQQKMLPFVMENIPPIYMEKALIELNESKEGVARALKEMRERAKANKRTCDINFVDDFLLQFLRHRKYDTDRAFRQLLNFTEFRILHSEWFECRGENIYNSPLKQYFSILPHRTADGCAVFIFEVGKWNPSKFSTDDLSREWLSLFFQSNRYPMTQINGYKVIYDFADTSFRHWRQCTPGNVYHVYNGTINCFPGRYKEIHLVNKNALMNATWTIFKAFLSQKLRNRAFFHMTPEGLLDHFPASMLPEHYGGTLKEFKMEEMKEWKNRAYKFQHTFPPCGQPNLEKESYAE